MWHGESMMVLQGVYGLPGIMVEVFGQGYEAPMDGNQFSVAAHISLPACTEKNEDGSFQLDPTYCFGLQVAVGSKPLFRTWGEAMGTSKYRTISVTIKADSMKEAYEVALEAALLELKPLAIAYQDRNDKIRGLGFRT